MKIILLDSIRSMQNVGAIFRNADGAWYDKIILTGYCPHPPRNEIWKTALGAEQWIDWEYFSDPIDALKKLKQQWYKIFSVELTDDAKKYSDFFGKKYEKMCLVMWNEITGVSKNILDLSDEKIIIPMKWKKASLNVSVAAGIVMNVFE